MTPPSGSVPSAPHSTLLHNTSDDAGHHARGEHFAGGDWTPGADDTNSVWSAASYWVRRKRAQPIADLTS